MSMSKFYVFLLCCIVPFMVGCTAANTLAKGITTKNISGNGTWIDSHVGLNVESKIPELKTTFISGDFSTVKAQTNAVTYREESSSSVFNAESITKKRFLSITLTDTGNVPDAIRAIANVLERIEQKETAAGKNAETTETQKQDEKKEN